MKSLQYERALPSAGIQVLLTIMCGLALAWMIVNEPLPLVLAAIIGVTFIVVFIQRPDLALLFVLIARALSDYVVKRPSVPGDVGIIARFLNPNVGLILIVILAGTLYILSHRVQFLRLPGSLPLVFLVLIGGIGLPRAPSIFTGLDRWLALCSELIVYALAATVLWNPQKIQRTINVLAVSFIGPALLGLNQIITKDGCRTAEIALLRVCGTFTHPNPYSFFLVIILSVFFGQALVHGGWRRVLAVLIVGTAAILLISTQTRSSWAGALIVLLTIGAARDRRVLLLATLLIVASVALVPSIGNRLADPFGGSFADRVSIWQGTYSNWIDATTNDYSSLATVLNRIAGTGPGSVGFLTSRFRGEVTAEHNDYLLMLFEYGALGLAAFLAMWASLIVSAYRTWRRSTNEMMKPVALSFFALTLAFPLISFTDNIVGHTEVQVYFWTLAGLTAAIGRTTAGARQRTSPGLPGSAAKPSRRGI